MRRNCCRGRHTGFNVRSLAESLKYYHDTLGLEIAEVRTEGPNEYIDKLTCIQGVVQHWAKVRCSDGYLLELVEWVKPDFYVPDTLVPQSYNDLGINHICFQVDSVDEVHKLLVDADYACRQIQTDPPGRVKNFSGYDPDGNIVEFVEVLEQPVISIPSIWPGNNTATTPEWAANQTFDPNLRR